MAPLPNVEAVAPRDPAWTTACFEPVTILPAQVASECFLPEQELMLAVLREAIDEYRECVLRPRPRTQRALGRLRLWFASDDVEWPYSFLNICEALDLDPHLVRARLRAWRVSVESARVRPARVRLPNRSMRGSRTRVVSV